VQFSDKNHQMSTDYGVLLPKEGISLRGLFLIDPQGVTRQITINDLPVGRSVEETIRLVKAFQVRSRTEPLLGDLHFG
jgi:peroxiredoxin (alkyl hydroperoxide reductase subunit C)